jgi:hypothetical protein
VEVTSDHVHGLKHLMYCQAFSMGITFVQLVLSHHLEDLAQQVRHGDGPCYRERYAKIHISSHLQAGYKFANPSFMKIVQCIPELFVP